MHTKILFLDRDGTLIINKHYLNDPKQIEYLPDVFTALNALKKLGFKFIIVTNQSGIPRGLISNDQLEQIHAVLESEFKRQGIDFLKIYHAPYLPESNHPDRKPNPGMILKAQKEFNIDLSQSWMVGDSIVDVAAGKNAGVRSIFLGNDDQIKKPFLENTVCIKSWPKILKYILSQIDS